MPSQSETGLDTQPATSDDRPTPEVASPANAAINDALVLDAQPSPEIDGVGTGPWGESGKAPNAETTEQATPEAAATKKPAQERPEATSTDEVNKRPLPTDAALEAPEQSAIAGYIAERLQRMKRARVDHRKLAGLVKATIDRTSLDEGISRPFTIGARDRLAETAAARLLRRGLETNDIPRALADAAIRLPEVAKRLEAQVDAASNHRRDRIDARQIRAGRKAGLLRGLDPWD
jgi:hypothetical protein